MLSCKLAIDRFTDTGSRSREELYALTIYSRSACSWKPDSVFNGEVKACSFEGNLHSSEQPRYDDKT